MSTTTGMKGGGFYDAHSSEQRAAIDAFLPWLIDATNSLVPEAGTDRQVTILDIGSAEGANAIYVMKELVAGIRTKSKCPISLCFSDLATNDFNSLFAKLFPQNNPAVFGKGTYPSAIAGSAFQRIFSQEGLDIVTTFNAIGFLERKPPGAMLENFILPMPPATTKHEASVNESEQEPYRDQAASDIHAFYSARAAELKPGGKLLVQVFGRNELHSTSHGIYDVLSDAIIEVIESGAVDTSYYRDLVFPIYFRSLEELTAPLYTDDKLKAAFQIERSDSVEISAPFNEEFDATGDTAKWASSYTNFLRAFTESIIVAALPEQAAKAELAEKIFSTVENLLIANRERYPFHYISLGVLLTRL